MSLFISSLNSGSNGNCYYIGNQDEAILVDAGISCRETEKRMKRLGLSLGKLRAIFISHEHSDHIYGLCTLSRKYHLPVYITSATLERGKLELPHDRVIPFKAYEPIRIGNLSVTAFPKFHDACDPHSFVVSSNTVKVGVFTDIGFPCEQVRNHFKQCHAAFLESNYDEALLDNGKYPYFLKNRIRDGRGHLSNTQALALFTRHKPSFMSHLFLSHLSRENNSPAIVRDLFSKNAGRTQIIIAPRNKETRIYHIRNTLGNLRNRSRSVSVTTQFQLPLFQ